MSVKVSINTHVNPVSERWLTHHPIFSSYSVFYYWLLPFLLLSNILVVMSTNVSGVRGNLSKLFVIFIVIILLLFQHELRKCSRATLGHRPLWDTILVRYEVLLECRLFFLLNNASSSRTHVPSAMLIGRRRSFFVELRNLIGRGEHLLGEQLFG